MITSDQRIERYRELPELLVPLYAAPESGTFLYSVYEKSTPTESDYQIFGNLIGDTILGFHKTSELPSLLQKEVGVSADDAQRIMGDLTEFLAPVIAQEKVAANKNHVELQELEKTFSPVQGTSAPLEATQKTEETPNEPHTPVQAMRTMQGDMSRVHGYGAYRAQFPDEPKEAEHTEAIIRSASQEDLLKEKPKLAGMPTYEEDGEGS